MTLDFIQNKAPNGKDLNVICHLFTKNKVYEGRNLGKISSFIDMIKIFFGIKHPYKSCL